MCHVTFCVICCLIYVDEGHSCVATGGADGWCPSPAIVDAASGTYNRSENRSTNTGMPK